MTNHDISWLSCPGADVFFSGWASTDLCPTCGLNQEANFARCDDYPIIFSQTYWTHHMSIMKYTNPFEHRSVDIYNLSRKNLSSLRWPSADLSPALRRTFGDFLCDLSGPRSTEGYFGTRSDLHQHLGSSMLEATKSFQVPELDGEIGENSWKFMEPPIFYQRKSWFANFAIDFLNKSNPLNGLFNGWNNRTLGHPLHHGPWPPFQP